MKEPLFFTAYTMRLDLFDRFLSEMSIEENMRSKGQTQIMHKKTAHCAVLNRNDRT